MTLYLNPGRIRNVGIFGLPTFNKSLAYGFSVNNGIFIPKLFKPGNNPWKMLGSFITSGTIANPQEIVGYNATADCKMPALGIRSGNVLGLFVSSNGTSWDIAIGYGNGKSSYVVNPNTTYFFEMGWTGAEYYVNAGTAPNSLTRIITVANSAPIYQEENIYWYLGYHRYSPDGYEIFNGTIDLAYFNVTINGQEWWNGITDGDLIQAGGNNVRVYGTPTINESLVSNFSIDNYLTVPQMFNPGANPWERVIKFTTGASVDDYQVLTGCGAEWKGTSFNIVNRKLKMWAASGNGGWDIAAGVEGTTELLIMTTYWLRQKFTGSQYLVDISRTGSFTGEEIRQITVDSSAALPAFYIFIGVFNSNWDDTSFMGSINLEGCYIDINGNRFWSGVASAAQYDYDYTVKISDIGKHGLYLGSRAIKSAYLGSSHVYQYNSYNPGTVLYERYGGNLTEGLTLQPGTYRIEMVGGGGGQGGFATNSGVAFGSGGGGSGAAIVFTAKITSATYIEVRSGSVGRTSHGYLGTGGAGGDSYVRLGANGNPFVRCNSSMTGSGGWSGHGSGGIVDYGDGDIMSALNAQITFQSNGNAGSGGGVAGGWGTGGASVYYGQGRGTGPGTTDGTPGMIKVTYLGYI
jgi:hypothetical protein